MATQRLLGEHRVAVHGHLEDSPRGLDQLGLDTGKLFLQLSRQTGGSGLVVSNDAVFDADVHGTLLSMEVQAIHES